MRPSPLAGTCQSAGALAMALPSRKKTPALIPYSVE